MAALRETRECGRTGAPSWGGALFVYAWGQVGRVGAAA